MRQFLTNPNLIITKGKVFMFAHRLNQLGFIRLGNMNRPNMHISRPRFNKKIAYGILAAIVIVGGVFFVSRNSQFSTSQAVAGVDSGDKIEIQPAKATMAISRQLEFPFQGEDPKQINNFKFSLENAELRDEIVVNGKKAQAVKGRQFLILNIKIVNDFNQSISVNAKDYVRLSVNGNQSEWLAPDIHNDPVTIQPISTKHTRLGFPINTTDKDLKLQVGEINGEKAIIDVSF